MRLIRLLLMPVNYVERKFRFVYFSNEFYYLIKFIHFSFIHLHTREEKNHAEPFQGLFNQEIRSN